MIRTLAILTSLALVAVISAYTVGCYWLSRRYDFWLGWAFVVPVLLGLSAAVVLDLRDRKDGDA